MGRVKLKIKRLENTNGRQATYAKRKNGILKKANELSILCDIDIVLLMFSPSGKPSLCCGRRSTIEEVLTKFAQVTPQERTKRKFESLEVLKKTFQKLDHDVNIREFIASNNSTIEDLSTQVRMMQGRLSEIHGRLSYWREIDKINNVEHLEQLEFSIRQSLDQLRTHKEHLVEQQQQHVIQLDNANFVKDWSTCSMPDGIQIPLEQQLQSMSWILNNNNTNIVPEEHNSIPQRDVECSASSSFGSYPGYFGTGKSPEITISGQETSFLDELTTTGQLKPQSNTTQQQQQQQQQFNNNLVYNPNLHNDPNQQSLAPPVFNFPINQRDFHHLNGFFEAPQGSVFNNNQPRFGSSSNSLPCSIAMFDELFFSQMQQPN